MHNVENTHVIQTTQNNPVVKHVVSVVVMTTLEGTVWTIMNIAKTGLTMENVTVILATCMKTVQSHVENVNDFPKVHCYPAWTVPIKTDDVGINVVIVVD